MYIQYSLVKMKETLKGEDTEIYGAAKLVTHFIKRSSMEKGHLILPITI